MKQLLILVALMPLFALSQTTRQPLTVLYTSLGAYSKNFVDIFSGTSNQAALAQIKSGGFGVYGERRFLLNELNQFSAIVALPTASGTFALQGDYFGSSSYNENQLGLAYARKVAQQVDVGIKLNYHSIMISGYGNATAVNVEAGTIIHLTEKLHAGFHLYNPFSSKFSKSSSEQLPSVIKSGLGYEVSSNFFISGEFVKQEDVPVNINVGFQYNIQPGVFVRGGVSTFNNNSFAGVGLLLGQLRIDLNASYHNQLGFTPGVLLTYQFNKTEKE